MHEFLEIAGFFVFVFMLAGAVTLVVVKVFDWMFPLPSFPDIYAKPCCQEPEEEPVQCALTEDDRLALESVDAKCARAIELFEQETVQLQEVVGRLDVLEKAMNKLDETDVALLEGQEDLKQEYGRMRSQVSQMWDEFTDTHFDDDDDDFTDSDLEDDWDSDLDDSDLDDDSEFEWEMDDEEEELHDTPYLQEQPGLTHPAVTIQMTGDEPLDTYFPASISSEEWMEFLKWKQQEAGKTAYLEGAD